MAPLNHPCAWAHSAVLSFDRSLFLSAVEPTEEGTTQPKRNKETTRSTTDCLKWAIGEGIGQKLGMSFGVRLFGFVLVLGCVHLRPFQILGAPITVR